MEEIGATFKVLSQFDTDYVSNYKIPLSYIRGIISFPPNETYPKAQSKVFFRENWRATGTKGGLSELVSCESVDALKGRFGLALDADGWVI